MHKRNAFGQIIHRPTLRFAVGENGEGGGATDAAAQAAAADAGAAVGENGFPANTPIAEMTPDQREAYWKHQSRKHENTAKSREDYDAIKQELADLKAAGLTQEQKDQNEALEAARLAGENIGAARYLKSAVEAKFQLLTGKSDEDVTKAFQRVDAASFVDDKGDIDVAALNDFAALFGTNAGSGTTSDPVREALDRQRRGGGGSGAGSISELKAAAIERMTGKK